MGKGNSPNSRNGCHRGFSVPGAFKLDHLQPVKPILFFNLLIFHFYYWESNSYFPKGLIMGKGNSPNSRIGLDRGVSVPGAFKLDHLHPVKPILFSKFYNFFTFILGGQFFLPQRSNNGKREFSQLHKRMRERGFSAWGIQTGSFAAC